MRERTITLRHRGIHYDIGTQTLAGGSSRPDLTPHAVESEIADIAEELHATAVRITGGDEDRMRWATDAALRHDLDVWISPMLPNGDTDATLALIDRSASLAGSIRRPPREVVLVIGCELSAFASGIVPGDDQAARLALLGDMARLMTEVVEKGLDPQARFDELLAAGVKRARTRFDGPITYAAGAWEQVDWSLFDIVGLDAYRDAGNRATYPQLLTASAGHGRPAVVTEVGCATYVGAADAGGLGWQVLDRATEPRRLREGVVRDEAEQATEVAALLTEIERAGLDGAFVYTYVAPGYPSSPDPAHDLDAASFALVRSWRDGRRERKRSYRAVADAYDRR